MSRYFELDYSDLSIKKAQEFEKELLSLCKNYGFKIENHMILKKV